MKKSIGICLGLLFLVTAFDSALAADCPTVSRSLDLPDGVSITQLASPREQRAGEIYVARNGKMIETTWEGDYCIAIVKAAVNNPYPPYDLKFVNEISNWGASPWKQSTMKAPAGVDKVFVGLGSIADLTFSDFWSRGRIFAVQADPGITTKLKSSSGHYLVDVSIDRNSPAPLAALNDAQVSGSDHQWEVRRLSNNAAVIEIVSKVTGYCVQVMPDAVSTEEAPSYYLGQARCNGKYTQRFVLAQNQNGDGALLISAELIPGAARVGIFDQSNGVPGITPIVFDEEMVNQFNIRTDGRYGCVAPSSTNIPSDFKNLSGIVMMTSPAKIRLEVCDSSNHTWQRIK